MWRTHICSKASQMVSKAAGGLHMIKYATYIGDLLVGERVAGISGVLRHRRNIEE